MQKNSNSKTRHYKQCKQMERLYVMGKGSSYFLLLDDKPKQKYKAKINNIQEYDPYQIKRTFRRY